MKEAKQPSGDAAEPRTDVDLSVVVEALTRLNLTLKAVEERLATPIQAPADVRMIGPAASDVASAEQALAEIEVALAVRPRVVTSDAPSLAE